MIDIVRATLDEKTIEELISLSLEWEKEDITFGYRKNTKEDLFEPCFLAKDESKTIGYIFGHYYDNEKQVADIAIGDKCFEVDELYVVKEYRNKGIGKILFDTLEEEVKDSVSYITLPTATKDYLRILHFYHDEVGMTFHSAFLFKKTK